MDPVLIFTLIEKGLTLLPTLVSAGMDITQRVQQLIRLSKGGAEGTLTSDEVDRIRTDFDADLAEFNSPLPPV